MTEELWQPAICQRCGKHPVKKGWRKQCWWCTHPGVVPPPCKVCRSPEYWFNNYCEHCHPSRARLRARRGRTCAECLSWGVHSGQRCIACILFSKDKVILRCRSCRRPQLPVKQGYCRLCWHQARLYAGPGNKARMEPFLCMAAIGQQLFFSNMVRSVRLQLPPALMRSAPVAAPALRMPTGQQLLLVDLRRDLMRFRAEDEDRSAPQVVEALQIAARLSEERGWTRDTRWGVERGLVIALSQQPPLQPVPYSELVPLTSRSISVERTVEVLTELDLFVDDRPDLLERWLTVKLAGLPEPMSEEIRAWVRVLRGQAPRSRKRKDGTVRTYVSYVLPPLRRWAADGRQSLREITRDQIKEALTGLTGHELKHTTQGLKSMFAALKRQKMIFANPMSRVHASHPDDRTVPPPLHEGDLQAVAAAAADPERRLLFVLAAVQALRPVQMRDLLLENINLGAQRLLIGNNERRLDRITDRALSVYLEHRRRRWPLSPNPHLLISQQTAHEHGPVSSYWVKSRFVGLAATLDRIRVDRHVDELMAHGPDPMHFMAMFGVAATTAVRYTSSVAAMLGTTIEDAADQTQGGDGST